MGHHSDQPFDGEAFKHKHEDMTKKLKAEHDLVREQLAREPSKSEQDAMAAEVRKLRRALHDTTNFVGSTGVFPEGKLTKQDEGEIRFRVGSENDKVVLDFGTPVHWVGMSPKQAAEMASSLLKWARLVGRKQGKTVTLDLDAV